MPRYSYFTNVMPAIFCSDKFQNLRCSYKYVAVRKAISYFCLHSALIYKRVDNQRVNACRRMGNQYALLSTPIADNGVYLRHRAGFPRV